MSIRLNPQMLPDLLASLQASQQNEQNGVQQVSTGRRVNKPSDDPAAVAALVNNNAQFSEDAQFQVNLNDLQAKYQLADSAMNTAVQLMTSAISLGAEGASGTLTAANRQTIAAQVAGLQQQMLALANSSYQGAYIFAGTKVTAAPFSQNPLAPSGVTYNGNTAVTSVQISEGQSIQTNLPGDQIFTNASGNVFGALNDLANSLNSGAGIEAANTEVQNAFHQLTAQRVFYGDALNQVQSKENFLSQDKLNLSQQQTSLVGADMAQAITNLSQAQVTQQATLSATAQVLNLPTLLNYIK